LRETQSNHVAIFCYFSIQRCLLNCFAYWVVLYFSISC